MEEHGRERSASLSNDPGRELGATLMAAAAVALWSTVATAFKLALRELAPPDLLALSTFVSAGFLGLLLIVRRVPRPDGLRYVFRSALLGVLNPLTYYLILFSAYDRLPAQVAQPLNYTWPLFLALLAVPLTGKRVTRRDITGLVLSLCGVVLIAGRTPGGGPADPAGIALATGSGVIWALSWLLGARDPGDGVWRLFFGFITAGAVLAVVWVLRGHPLPVSATGWAAAIWVGLFEMGVTFVLWDFALKRTDRPGRIGSLVYLGPFVSLIWIRLVLREPIRISTVAGLVIIVLGILLSRTRGQG